MVEPVFHCLRTGRRPEFADKGLRSHLAHSRKATLAAFGFLHRSRDWRFGKGQEFFPAAAFHCSMVEARKLNRRSRLARSTKARSGHFLDLMAKQRAGRDQMDLPSPSWAGGSWGVRATSRRRNDRRGAADWSCQTPVLLVERNPRCWFFGRALSVLSVR